MNGFAFVEMQIGSVDAGGGHGDNHLSGPGSRVVMGVDSDAAGPVDDYRTHSYLPTLSLWQNELRPMRFAYLPGTRSRAFERGERRSAIPRPSA